MLKTWFCIDQSFCVGGIDTCTLYMVALHGRSFHAGFHLSDIIIFHVHEMTESNSKLKCMGPKGQKKKEKRKKTLEICFLLIE